MKYKAIKFKSFILYTEDVTDNELKNFISDSQAEYIETENKKCIEYNMNKYFLYEWTEYFVKAKTNNFVKSDFNNIGSYYTQDFGILLIKNFIGTINFIDVIFDIKSFKISTDEFNSLLDIIDSRIRNLAIQSFSPTGITRGEFISNIDEFKNNNYYQHIKIYNLMNSNILLPLFRYIRKNLVSKLVVSNHKVEIHSSSDYSDDVFNDLFSGELDLIKVVRSNKLSQRLNGFIPQTVNDKRYLVDIDTPENQFIKYFLEYLIKSLSQFSHILKKMKNNSSQNKNQALGFNLLLENTITHHNNLIKEYRLSFYKEISSFSGVNKSNNVITQKYGYRNLYQEFININNQPHNIFNSESLIELYQNKSVDKLYEYVGLFSLLDSLEKIYDYKSPINKNIFPLTSNSKYSTNLNENGHLSFTFSRKGMPDCTLFFQKRFSLNNNQSWSVNFIPDFTIMLSSNYKKSTFIHFDAKFKTNNTKEENTEDIQKMHSYKDAIYDSYGAYILYPGERKIFYSKSDNPIPEVGAIPLRYSKKKDLLLFLQTFIYAFSQPEIHKHD